MSSVQELRAAVSPSPTPEKKADKTPMKSQTGLIGMLVLAGVVGACIGVALDRVVLPHGPVSPPPASATLAKPQAAALGGLVASGSFIQPDANNPLHRGSGAVSVHGHEVVLGADFAVTPGPDYRVLLVPKPVIRATADVANTMYVDLGPLAAFKGEQSFKVPAGVDLSNYPSVVIWCAAYGTLISTADLSFAKSGS